MEIMIDKGRTFEIKELKEAEKNRKWLAGCRHCSNQLEFAKKHGYRVIVTANFHIIGVEIGE